MLKIGIGKDIHVLKKGIPLVLGGVNIPYEFGLESYSDGDVVIHSLVDALLGASGLGDIGEYFPSSNPKYKGISSEYFLKETKRIIGSRKIINIDILIICEKPKISIYKGEIKKRIADILEIDEKLVNIKAGTNEGLDSIGKKIAIEADSAVLLEEN